MERIDLPLNQIKVNTVALRDAQVDDVEFAALRESIRQHGVQDNIVVALNPFADQEGEPPYVLINGLQRYTISQELGKETIPAAINDTVKTESQVRILQIQLNRNRVDTKPVQYRDQIVRIMSDDPTLSKRELAALLTMPESKLNNLLQLKKLEPSIEPLVEEGAICAANAFKLAELPPEEQIENVERAQTEDSLTFATYVNARKRELHSARMAGREAKTTYIHIERLRRMSEVKAEIDTPEAIVNVIDGITDPIAIAKEVLAWVLKSDTQSIADGQAKWDAEQKEKEEKRARRAEERRKQKEAEARAKADAVEEVSLDEALLA